MSKDLIRREDVRAILCEECIAKLGMCGGRCNDVERIENIPAVDAERKWISVEDRLPGEDGHYLVVYEYEIFGNIRRVTTFLPFDTDIGFYYNKEQIDDTYERKAYDGITHWMPLPQPPEMNAEDINVPTIDAAE
jgi:hypothetical protein